MAARRREARLGREDAERPYEIVVLVASAGGIAAIGQVLRALPHDFPLPVVVVQHRSPLVRSTLDTTLARHTPLKVKFAEPGEEPRPGIVYIAPADHHLVIAGDRTLRFTDGTRVRHVLSSANPLFASAARVFGPGVIAVVLTGYDSDGTDGVQAVKRYGGTVIAQDRATSEAFEMPHAAIGTGDVDLVLPLHDIAPALVRLAGEDGWEAGAAFPEHPLEREERAPVRRVSKA
jgi:two-component system chemotaxis response regulator CheB